MDLLELLVNVKDERDFSFNYKTFKIEDNLFDLLENSDNDYVYIGTADMVENYYNLNPNSEWYIKSIFELGFPFLFYTNLDNGLTGESCYNLLIRKLLENQYWSIYIFTREKPEKINIGFSEHESLAFKYALDTKEKSYSFFHSKAEEYVKRNIIPPDASYRFVSEMSSTLEQIQKCIETNLIPELTQEKSEQIMYSFTSIPYDAFNINYLHNLSRYKDSVVDDFGLPSKKEYIKKLSECTEFIFLGDDYYSSDIKKGDIVCKEYFFDDYRQCVYIDLYISEKDEDGSVVTNSIIRPKDISPYYIWNVLMSEFNIDYSLKNIEHHENNSDQIDIGNNPILITDEIDESYYKKLYELHKQSKFSVQQKLENNRTSFYDSNAKEIILKDLNEVKDCFNAKAYKAAIILAGSILEAFLIDWLSEKDNKNYFEEDFMVFDKYRKRYRRADLVDYINKINELEKPNWMEAADKATLIRKKRNLVHAKLYINDNDISKETCTEVIDYLEYVINTRWK